MFSDYAKRKIKELTEEGELRVRVIFVSGLFTIITSIAFDYYETVPQWVIGGLFTGGAFLYTIYNYVKLLGIKNHIKHLKEAMQDD